MVAVRLQQQLCLEDDIVIHMGDIGNDMYLLRHGEMEVLDPLNNNRAIVLLREGAAFGDLALMLENSRRSNTIRARTRCEYFSLSRGDMEDMYKDFPEVELEMRRFARN